MGRRADEVAAAGRPPISLSDAELELDHLPLTRTPQPEAVWAWVRYGPELAVRVEGRAVAWTPRAVAVEWETASGEVGRA